MRFVRLAVVGLALGLLLLPSPVGAASTVSKETAWTTSYDPFLTLADAPSGRDEEEEGGNGEDDDDDDRRGGNWVRALLTSGDVLPSGFTFPMIPDGTGAVTMRDDRVDVFVNHELNNGANHGGWAKVSRLRLREGSGTLQSAELAIDGSQGYERFCSGSAVQGYGFRDPMYFANEEVDDGIVVAVNARTGAILEMPWLGAFAHENTIHVAQFHRTMGKTVLLSFEDGPATESEVYLYVANSPDEILKGRGQLYVFTAVNDAYDAWDDVYFGTPPVAGRFVPLTWDWRTQDEADLHAEAREKGAFQFIRPEDGAFDKRRGRENVLYMADTGNDRDENGALIPPGKNGQTWERGRIYRFVFTDRTDPTRATLQVWLDGNDPSAPGYGLMSNPDNVDTSRRSLMIQEDRIGVTRSPPTTPYDITKNAKILRFDLNTREVSVVAFVNQYLDHAARHGDWESSGILDVSKYFGSGTWLVTVQAHSIKEGGQLLLMSVRGT